MQYIAAKKLLEYLEEKDEPNAVFAEKIGVSKYAVAKWLKDERQPRADHKFKIEKATGGRVAVADWLTRIS